MFWNFVQIHSNLIQIQLNTFSGKKQNLNLLLGPKTGPIGTAHDGMTARPTVRPTLRPRGPGSLGLGRAFTRPPGPRSACGENERSEPSGCIERSPAILDRSKPRHRLPPGTLTHLLTLPVPLLFFTRRATER